MLSDTDVTKSLVYLVNQSSNPPQAMLLSGENRGLDPTLAVKMEYLPQPMGMLGSTKPVLRNSSRESPVYGLPGDCSRSGYLVHHGDN